MNKIEEIFKEEFNKNHTASNEDKVSFKQIAYRAMKKFGNICFNIAREDSYINANGFNYDTYEDFLKEIEDEL